MRRTSAYTALPLLAAGLVLASAGACGENRPPTGTFDPSEGIVYGEIRDAAGQLQANAVVEVLAYREDCAQPAPVVTGLSIVSDGRYRMLLRSAYQPPYTVCVVVSASSGSAPGAARGIVSDRRMTMRGAAAGPPDSLRVDIVVQ